MTESSDALQYLLQDPEKQLNLCHLKQQVPWVPRLSIGMGASLDPIITTELSDRPDLASNILFRVAEKISSTPISLNRVLSSHQVLPGSFQVLPGSLQGSQGGCIFPMNIPRVW